MPPKRKTRNPGLRESAGVKADVRGKHKTRHAINKSPAIAMKTAQAKRTPIQRRLTSTNGNATTANNGKNVPIKKRLQSLEKATITVSKPRGGRSPAVGAQHQKKQEKDDGIITDVFRTNAKGKVMAVAVAAKPKPKPNPAPVPQDKREQNAPVGRKRGRDREGDGTDVYDPGAPPPAKAAKTSEGNDEDTEKTVDSILSRKAGDRYGERPTPDDTDGDDDDYEGEDFQETLKHRAEKAKQYEPTLVELRKMDLSEHKGLWRVDVRNLQPECKKSDVKTLFDFIGPVHLLKMHYDRKGQSRGMAAIYFQDWQNAIKASEEYNGRIFDGKKLRVEIEPRFQRAFFNMRLERMRDEMKAVTEKLQNAQAKLKSARGAGNSQPGRGTQGAPGGHKRTPVKFTVTK